MTIKNGIILAGGTGTRLFPLTHSINKHLLPVDGKFIIDYPINTLKQMGIENLTVVLGGSHFSQVVDHLKDGRDHNLNINYIYQGEAKGISQAINLCQRYVSDQDRFAVILGDNIFSDPIKLFEADESATIIVCKHPELNRFGVATFNNDELIAIEEKPKVLSDTYKQYAITGCYLFDQQYFDFFKTLTPSARDEYEICDIITQYWKQDKLDTTAYSGDLWSDAGMHESIARCNQYFYNKNNSGVI